MAGGAPPSAALSGGVTPLLAAAGAGHQQALRALLAGGASAGEADAEGNNALHHAARGGHAAAVALLMEAGADSDARNARLLTPFIVAVANGQLLAAATLEGMDPGAGGEGLGAGQAALSGSRASLSSNGSAYGGEILQSKGQLRRGLLAAAAEGDVGALTRLLAAGALVDDCNNDGDTGLHYAALAGQLEAAQVSGPAPPLAPHWAGMGQSLAFLAALHSVQALLAPSARSPGLRFGGAGPDLLPSVERWPPSTVLQACAP